MPRYALLLCVLWAAAGAETSDDYELLYVNLDNEIDNGLRPTEDREFAPPSPRALATQPPLRLEATRILCSQ